MLTKCGTRQVLFGAVVAFTVVAVTPGFGIVLAAVWYWSSYVRRVATQQAAQLESRANDEIRKIRFTRLVGCVTQVTVSAALLQVSLGVSAEQETHVDHKNDCEAPNLKRLLGEAEKQE
jgi:NADH:ubiquinone oxidoreductase subunit 4 (subunit M)